MSYIQFIFDSGSKKFAANREQERRTAMYRFIAGVLLLAAAHASTFAPIPSTNQQSAMQNLSDTNDFQVIEFRRYQIKDGGLAKFATYPTFLS